MKRRILTLLAACSIIIGVACGNLAFASSETNTADNNAIDTNAEFAWQGDTAFSLAPLEDTLRYQHALIANYLREEHKRHVHRSSQIVTETRYVGASVHVYDIDHTYLSDGWMYRLAGCETGGTYEAVGYHYTGNGYWGFFQFMQSTWESNGGEIGHRATEYSYEHQAEIARNNLRHANFRKQHSACSRTMASEGYQTAA